MFHHGYCAAATVLLTQQLPHRTFFMREAILHNQLRLFREHLNATVYFTQTERELFIDGYCTIFTGLIFDLKLDKNWPGDKASSGTNWMYSLSILNVLIDFLCSLYEHIFHVVTSTYT